VTVLHVQAHTRTASVASKALAVLLVAKALAVLLVATVSVQ
jgi:hypothetical protein